MYSVSTIDEKIVAIGHDLLEDTDMSAKKLLNYGFPTHIVEAIILLTNTPDVTYKERILLIKKNALAREVKIADMRDNSDLFRLHDVESKHLKMIKKYHWGMKQLRDNTKYITSPRG